MLSGVDEIKNDGEARAFCVLEGYLFGSGPQPEVTENVNTEELGNLGLTMEEESAIVAFMRTLSDDYRLK